MPALAPTLSTLLLALWPRRRHQELLLDLGEHKAWTPVHRQEAVHRLAAWLVAELGLPEALPEVPSRPESHPSPTLSLADAKPVAGVGLHTVALAKLVGTAPKTLSNLLTQGLRSDRRDHRWVRFLARVDISDTHADAWIFHRRSPSAIASQLASSTPAAYLDASDALLVLSLVSLWQRRRRPEGARASRGVSVPRRLLSKPVAALQTDVLVPAQVAALVNHGLWRGGSGGATVVAFALEAALTEAHLAPHQARSNALTSSGEPWLRLVDVALDEPKVADLLGVVEHGLFRWRVARLRAYASRTLTPAPDDAIRSHPYVALALVIDAARDGFPVTQRFPPAGPGYFMLVPQARRLGLLEEK